MNISFRSSPVSTKSTKIGIVTLCSFDFLQIDGCCIVQVPDYIFMFNVQQQISHAYSRPEHNIVRWIWTLTSAILKLWPEVLTYWGSIKQSIEKKCNFTWHIPYLVSDRQVSYVKLLLLSGKSANTALLIRNQTHSLLTSHKNYQCMVNTWNLTCC